MKRLNAPLDSMEVSYNACTFSILDKQTRLRFEVCLPIILELEAEYTELSKTGKSYKIAPHENSTLVNPKIIKNVKKDELIHLYGYYMVKRKPGRNVYDRIMAAAKEECPFCGGIGITKNLDHFLPKAYFSQFSVLPVNLVPSCRDCNMEGKGSSFAKVANEQLIHPYLDKDIIFNDQWVFARVIDGFSDDVAIEYFVDPPAHWEEVDKERVRKHFKDFDLAKRYSLQAGGELGGLRVQRKMFLEKFGSKEFKETVLRPVSQAKGYFINHWKRVMYKALERDLEFTKI